MIKIKKKFFPNYSSKLIRVGSNYDGGYVLPKEILRKSKICISFGIFDDCEFEYLVNTKYKIKVYAYDLLTNYKFLVFNIIKKIIKTILFKESIYNLKKSIISFFLFIKTFKKKQNEFFQKKIVSHTKFINKKKQDSISSIIRSLNLKKFILKIDIEGSEYALFKEIIKYEKKITCLIIEFHSFHKNQKKILKFLKRFKHKLVHIHVNNFGYITKAGMPTVVEMTFVNKNLCKLEKNKNIYYPLKGLDRPCNYNAKDEKIIFI